MKSQVTIVFLFIMFSLSLFGQDSNGNEEIKSESKPSLRFQGDSRRTIINKKSVGITGIRLGVLFKEKTEVGLGIYSSNLFGILGSTLEKDYQDKSTTPPIIFPAEIDFQYFSIYGEYRLVNTNRLVLTANSQVGLGFVNIDFVEPTNEREDKREGKGLIEHSIKADVKTLRWLRLIGGVGYRYLIAGEQQLKDAFNAPIYIVGFSVDFKNIRRKDKRK